MSQSSIMNLVVQKASERELQIELKSNLSILGAAYAHPKDEYIVFSEFPISHGNVDFIVFTGRSRMDIILIEVKGANFNFLNSDDTIAADINIAVQQVRERFYEIQRNYESFRRDAHDIRKAVEGGEQRYNSTLGSYGCLLVDSEKDIDIWGVVIGGRTQNDSHESRTRHQFEMSTPRIMLESWDSWIRKHL